MGQKTADTKTKTTTNPIVKYKYDFPFSDSFKNFLLDVIKRPINAGKYIAKNPNE